MSLREGEEDQNTFKFMAPHTTPAWAIRLSYLKVGPLEVCKNVFQCVYMWERRCKGMKTTDEKFFTNW